MKQLKIIVLLTSLVFLSSCSFGYEILIINDSDELIEVRYRINAKGYFYEPKIGSVEDWKIQKSIRRFWTEKKSWQQLPATEYETNWETRERVIRIAPRQLIQIESGNYNPETEDYSDLTNIVELKINTSNGEIVCKGNLLLNHFEKDGSTFIKTYKDELKDRDLK